MLLGSLVLGFWVEDDANSAKTLASTTRKCSKQSLSQKAPETIPGSEATWDLEAKSLILPDPSLRSG